MQVGVKVDGCQRAQKSARCKEKKGGNRGGTKDLEIVAEAEALEQMHQYACRLTTHHSCQRPKTCIVYAGSEARQASVHAASEARHKRSKTRVESSITPVSNEQ